MGMKNMDKNMEEQRKKMRKEMEEQRQSWNEKQRLSPFSSMQKIMESQMKAMDSMFDGSPFESMDKIMDMQMKEMSGLMQNFFGGQKNEKENKKEKEIVQTNEKEDGGDLCGTCVNITTEIRDQFLTKENEDLALSALKGICSKLGPLNQVCISAVEEYVPQAFEMAKQLLADPHMVCSMAGLCEKPTSKETKTSFMKFPSEEMASNEHKFMTEACSSCSVLAHGLKKAFWMQGFAEEFPKAICTIFSDENDKTCMSIARAFTDVFSDQVDPALLCASGFCTNSTVDAILEAADDKLLGADDHDKIVPRTNKLLGSDGIDELMAMRTGKHANLPRPCKACIRHTKIWIAYMERKIKQSRRKMIWGCKFALNKTKCIEAVENFVNKTIEGLEHMCPYKSCVKFGYCPPKTTTTSTTTSTTTTSTTTKPKGPIEDAILIRGVPLIA